MLTVWLSFAAVGGISSGCGKDEAAPASPTAGANAGSAGAPAPAVSELDTMVVDMIAAYDRMLKVNCPCFVRMGSYASLDECFAFGGSNDMWAPCAKDALRPFDSPETREILGCMLEQFDSNTACYVAADCDIDARAMCGASPLQCLGSNFQIGLELAMKCPDTFLLPRL
jgi:hypothetical protein